MPAGTFGQMFILLLCFYLIGSCFGATDVCYVGYAMDTYCINRGFLLSDPAVKTLESPNKHSVHCLVDVAICRVSGYEILAPNPDSHSNYCRAYTMDQKGNEMFVEYARSVGDCSTCDSNNGGIKDDFQVTIMGTVDDPTDVNPVLRTDS